MNFIAALDSSHEGPRRRGVATPDMWIAPPMPVATAVGEESIKWGGKKEAGTYLSAASLLAK